MHLSTNILTGKAPMDLAATSITLLGQSYNVLPHLLLALDALGQTIALKNADLDLGQYSGQDPCLSV